MIFVPNFLGFFVVAEFEVTDTFKLNYALNNKFFKKMEKKLSPTKRSIPAPKFKF